MAFEIITIDQTRRDAGFYLLQKTDDIGFNASGAGWYRPTDSKRWRYFLITPMIDSKGPKWVYERLMDALRVLKFPEGIKPLEIHLVSPRESRFYDLKNRLQVPNVIGDKNLFHASDDSVRDYGIEAIVIYRLRNENNRAGDTARIFEAKVKELLAA
ncbi:hypothetical protein [Neokomagataea anthophila]|uniref:Uncharacterized protein n=1 Tax=Neokomagataea anthophila TaxID=2826925 RepID=A0ABS5E7Z5_9PROT|nr:hypothetical protein [Neokomagataea anthophila]MBR0560037.1 hypothetical protein [Neokomagataea anthophila]